MKGIELIGISGKATAGKDTLGRSILRPRGFVPYSIAWPMKIGLVGRRRLTHEEAFVKPKDDRVRGIMQAGGDEEGRQVYGEDYWIRQADEWLYILRDEYRFDKVYLPDVRYWNEAEWVRNHGGKLIRIVGGGLENMHQSLHASETELDEWPLEEWDAIVHGHSSTHVLESSLIEQGVLKRFHPLSE